MALDDTQRQHLSTASRLAIRQAMPELEKHWRKGTWLSSGNPYLKNVGKQIRKEENLQSAPLCEYIAASAVVHCFDGWSYLGRALEAEMSGDPNAARHLGYYAELRAAMSILASEGIGIIDGNCIIVDTAQKCSTIKTERRFGTHRFAWDALETWAELSASHVLFQAIRPSDIPLQDWLEHFGLSGEFVAQKWLPQWGLDLSRFSDDKKARNLASYEPSAFVSPKPQAIRDIMLSISQLWEMCGPESSGGFPVLDRHLLRISLEMRMPLPRNRKDEQLYRRRVENMLGALGLSEGLQRFWREFLNYEPDEETPQIIQDAGKKDNPLDPNYSRQILARATLLLRVATGLSADLLDQAGTKVKNDLEFWWQSPEVRRRLWPEKKTVDSFPDLWQDVEIALESIEEWMDQNGSADRHSLWQNYSSEVSTLSTTERMCLWGLGL